MSEIQPIAAVTPGAERIITVATRPGTVITFNTYDETGWTGIATGTISHEAGMSELGNLSFAVDATDGTRHYVSRYAFVVPAPSAPQPGETVIERDSSLPLRSVQTFTAHWLDGRTGETRSATYTEDLGRFIAQQGMRERRCRLTS